MPSNAALLNADVLSDDPGGTLLPVVGGLSIGRGSTSGGQSVTMAGENFTDGSQVWFADAPATAVTVERFDRLSAIAPPHIWLRA